MKNNNDTTRKYSLLAGISLIVMTILAIYSFAIVLQPIYVENNQAETALNIQNNHALYLSGAIGWVLILITDLLVTLGFYKYLKTVNMKLAILSGLFRLAYSLILAYGIVYLFTSNLSTFMHYWSVGLFIIGFHLIFTGIGAIKSPKVPLLIGILLIIAGTGYSVIHGIYQFLPEYTSIGNSIESIMALPMTIGELSFGIWLLWRGGK